MSAAKRRGQPLQFFQPADDRVAARAGRRQLVGKLDAGVAGSRRRLALFGQECARRLMGGLGAGDRRLQLFDRFAGFLGLGRRRLGRPVGFGPAGVDEARLERADLVAELAIALGGAGLPAQRRGARFLLAEHFAEPLEIGFGRPQFLLGILAPRVKAGDAGGLFEQQPPLGRLGGDDRPDLALADQGRRMRAGGGIGEQQGDVLGADVAAVDAIGGPGAPLDPAGDFAFAGLLQLVAGVMLELDGDFGEIAGRPGRGAGEDDVVHAAAAQALGAALAHHPANRFEQVGLAAAVGADDAGQARLDPEVGGFDEALEAAELQSPDTHYRPRGGI